MGRAPTSAPRILVADDDATTRVSIAGMLKEAGYAVTAVMNGAEALRQMQQTNIALAFLDIWMPELTGLEVLARVRARGAQTKIIIMTSDDTPETVLRAIREQAYQYLTKPVEPRTLLELLNDALAAKPVSLPIEVLSARPNWLELLVPCDFEMASRITGFIAQLASDLTVDIRDQIGQAFRELLLNAIEWGGRLDPNQKVRISYLRGQRMVLYRIADPGPGFSFSALTHAAAGQPTDQPMAHVTVRDQLGIRPGGFGIVMTRAMADELLYNEAHNEVIFIKYLTSSVENPGTLDV